ncbi:hypothetical protein DPEC_G00210580 [Dallia pectoralis]|uniref:Uncharacterized protein n=1 Tax=Dallia pectoralis TaxID=75939 RepID=A0ACC2G5X0_DALPE|nr:hypothetical protein DPEC_G00210580 [Dallia pectoralis]
MNTDFQNHIQVPQAKNHSHLTIKVPSKLMSKPDAQNAPKPSPSSSETEEEQCPRDNLSNGDLASSDGDPEDPVLHSTDRIQDEVEPGRNLNDNEIPDAGGEDNEREECVDSVGKEGEAFCNESVLEGTSASGAHLTVNKQNCTETDDLNPRENDEDDSSVEPDHHPVCDKVFPCQNGDEEEAGFREQEDNRSSSPRSEKAVESIGLREHLDEVINEDEECAPGGEYLQCMAPTDEAGEANDLLLGAHCCAHSPVPEEYPYDVIGPVDEPVYTCDTGEPGEPGVWQPERATKDTSGRFRFSGSTEDVFGPYSVIEAVPADRMSKVDLDLDHRDTCCGDEPHALKMDTRCTSNQVHGDVWSKSGNMAESEDEQKRESEVQDSPELSHIHRGAVEENVDEYADINNAFCPDAQDIQQLEGASSEDYVEIGDDDETDDSERKQIRVKSVKERTAKREKAFFSQRNSCQPRLRLCNITVPADLDRTRTPELTNRVVFAHTTEAFEEDIEELDCHIVPYHSDSDSDSEEHIYEEAGFDSEGENFISLNRKTIVTRSRSYSGKVSGKVPETVPEEISEYPSGHDYCPVALEQNVETVRHHEQPEVNRLPSMKPRRFQFYPHSFSAEGRELSLGAHTEADQFLKEGRINRKDDTLSLPCVITSSGSFSQRSHQSSSGVSTPTSMVDIPPPFELAYITKKPVTKSSPSLLISVSTESTDHKPKKSKSSFKRFLALKFKRKTENKGFSDGSIRSSRSSSESSHHGPSRILDLERRSPGSPQTQPQSRMVMTQQRPPDLPSTRLLYKDRRKGDPKAYGGRGVSRVESFEERSRRPLMPLPMTKPRSISFPSADTSDYENIPAMSSDYENIQIPIGGRTARALTVTEFFEDPSRIAASCNENDGYVDMNSFPGIDSKPQSPEQEPERKCRTRAGVGQERKVTGEGEDIEEMGVNRDGGSSLSPPRQEQDKVWYCQESMV